MVGKKKQSATIIARHFNTMETSYCTCSIAIILQSSCGMVLTVFTRQVLTEPNHAIPYSIVLARKDCVV